MTSALAGLGDGMADGGAADQLAVEAVEQEPRGLDMHRVAHGQHAADARLDQPRGHGAEHGGLADGAAPAGLQHDERNPVLRQQVAQPVGADEVGLRIARAVVGLLEAERAELQLGQERAVAVEVDQVVRIFRGLGVAEHLLHAGERRRAAEVEADMILERVEGREERPRGEPGIDEAGVAPAG